MKQGLPEQRVRQDPRVPRGPQGRPGPAGPEGSISPLCANQAQRWIAGGDGTVTDCPTGLMWQQTTLSCTFVPTCSDNIYSWSAGLSAPDGTLFSSSSCLGNHCDWRIPNIAELRTLYLVSALGCGDGSAPCIDPVLGPTGDLYWSKTSVDRLPGEAFVIDFFLGDSTAGSSQKNIPAAYARGVRGGR